MKCKFNFVWFMRFIAHSIHCMRGANVVPKWAGTVLSDGINKYIYFVVSHCLHLETKLSHCVNKRLVGSKLYKILV
jgi:hypothetical protein